MFFIGSTKRNGLLFISRRRRRPRRTFWIGLSLMRKFFHLFKINDGKKIRPSSQLIRLNLARGRNENEREGRYSNACILFFFIVCFLVWCWRPGNTDDAGGRLIFHLFFTYHYVLRVMDCNWHRRVTAEEKQKNRDAKQPRENH